MLALKKEGRKIEGRKGGGREGRKKEGKKRYVKFLYFNTKSTAAKETLFIPVANRRSPPPWFLINKSITEATYSGTYLGKSNFP